MNLLCPLLSEPCPIADWGVNETLALLSFVVTSLALFATAWFARDAARQTEKLVRSELTAVLDMPTRPFGPEDEPYGEGLSIHLGRHAHGCHVSFSGGLRNIGRYPASDVGLVPEIEGAETELVIMARPQATLFPHEPHNQISFMWLMDRTVDGATDKEIVANHVVGHRFWVVVPYGDGNGPAPAPFQRCFTFVWDADSGQSRSKRVACPVSQRKGDGRRWWLCPRFRPRQVN